MKRKQERSAARNAVKDVDVTLPDPPASGIATTQPYTINNQTERARQTLKRKYARGSMPWRLRSATYQGDEIAFWSS